MTMSLMELEKEGWNDHLRTNSYNLVKIGPVDPEIIWLQEITKKHIKQKEINASKTSRYAEWAKCVFK